LDLTLLTVPDCPNAALFEERLAAALAGRPGAVVRRREIADEREAAQAGMHGSPTLLIDGVDPFAAPGQAPGLACRLYRDAAGRVAGAPPVKVLRRALEQAGARSGRQASRRTPLSATASEQNSSVDVHRLVSPEARPDQDWG
jgi:hypothetical protein